MENIATVETVQSRRARRKKDDGSAEARPEKEETTGKKGEKENDEWTWGKRKKEHFTSLSNGTQRDELCSTDLGQ